MKEKRAKLVGPPHRWKEKRDCQIEFLLQYGLQPNHYLLDFGCGVLRGGIPIIKYLDKGHYYGVESSADRLKEGIKELEECNLSDKTPNLSTECNIDMQFDYIWAFQVFIHLTDEILNAALFDIGNLLKETGVCYATVNNNRREGKWMEYPFVKRPFDFYKKEAAKFNLMVTSVNCSKISTHADGSAMLEIRKGH